MRNRIKYILIVLILNLIVVGIINGQEKSSEAQPYQNNSEPKNQPLAKASKTGITSVNQETTQRKENSSTRETEGYFRHLFLPEVLATIGLLIVGIVGTCAAIKTLKAIQRQGTVMIQQTRVLQRQAGSMERQFSEIRQQRGVMQEQLDTMKRQLELEHRPWVGIENPVVMDNALIFAADGARVQTRFRVANKGTASATNVAVQAGLVVKAHVAVDLNPLDRIINNDFFVCSPAFPTMLHNFHFGIFLLPGGQDNLAMTEWKIEPNDIPKVALVEVFLVGSVGYSDEFGKPHGTSFVYRYVRQDRQTIFAPKGEILGAFEIFGLSKSY